MPSGTIDLNLRPVRIGYVINPANRESLEKCTVLASFLWGGFYNPIIPIFKRLPRRDPHGFRERITRKELAQGYIHAFDPDYLIKLDDSDINSLNIGTAEIIDWSSFSLDELQSRKVDLGITFPNVFQELAYKEFRFIRNDDLKISFPKFGRSFTLFLKTCFGEVKPLLIESFSVNFPNVPVISETRKISNFFEESLRRNLIFPRRLTTYHLDIRRAGPFRSEGQVFLLDANNPVHLAEYWNLRALGWNVLPAPQQIIDEQAFQEELRRFVDENFGQSSTNQQLYFCTDFLKASSIPNQELDSFVKNLSIPVDSSSGESKVSIRHWYPRIWSDWARDKDGAVPSATHSDTKSYDLPEEKEDITLEPLEPPFKQEPFSTRAKFVNELSYRVYGFEKSYAEILPDLPEGRLRDIMRYWSLNEWRLSNGLLNHLSNGYKHKIYFSVPIGETTYQSWIEGKGAADFKISPAGLILKQILKQEDSRSIASLLSIEGVIEFIENANKKTSGVITYNQVQSELNRLKRNSAFIAKDQDEFINRLIKAGVIRLGANVPCPGCSQHSWYEYSALGSELECPKCNQKFYQSTNNPKKIEWAYKTKGAFSAVNSAYGSHTVLLSIRFFSQLFHLPLTMCPSYECLINGKPIEVDLGLILGRTMMEQSAYHELFFECKTKNDIKPSDTKKLLSVHKLFPTSIIVIATLKKEFSAAEKKTISAMLRKMKKVQADYQDYYPLLVLTRKELVADMPPPYSWKDLKGKWEKAGQNLKGYRELETLCTLTQQLYL